MLETLTALLTVYRLPAVFLGAFFFGDSVIFTTAYLTGQLSWPIIPVVAAAFFGTVLADSAWFWGGNYMSARFSNVQFLQKERQKVGAFLAKLLGEKPLFALVIVKFLYGSRIAMILYVAARGMHFGMFSLFNAIGTTVWLTVFFVGGYLTGKGVASTFPFTNAVQIAVVVLVVSFVLIRLFSMWLTRRMEGANDPV